jgi:hypothetical protein
MIGRPCKPDDDLKGLWQKLLGTPFPACGTADDGEVGQKASGSAPATAEQGNGATSNGTKSDTRDLKR